MWSIGPTRTCASYALFLASCFSTCVPVTRSGMEPDMRAGRSHRTQACVTRTTSSSSGREAGNHPCPLPLPPIAPQSAASYGFFLSSSGTVHFQPPSMTLLTLTPLAVGTPRGPLLTRHGVQQHVFRIIITILTVRIDYGPLGSGWAAQPVRETASPSRGTAPWGEREEIPQQILWYSCSVVLHFVLVLPSLVLEQGRGLA